LSQRFARNGVLILAQPEKVIGADTAGQAESFCAQSNPFACDTLPLVVVITDGEMFLEVFPRVLKIVLSFGREHGLDAT
jgi:hypothetical protein